MSQFYKRRFDWLDALARDHRISALAFRVAYVISGYVNRTCGHAWPSQDRLAREIGISSRAIRHNVDRLAGAGYLAITPAHGRGKTNSYRPTFEAGEDHAEIQPSAPRPRRPKRAVEPHEFEKFWRAYPRKVDKGTARKRFDAVLRSGKATSIELISGAERYAHQRAGKEEKYTKHAATWLTAEAWLNPDEPAAGNGALADGGMSMARVPARRRCDARCAPISSTATLPMWAAARCRTPRQWGGGAWRLGRGCSSKSTIGS
jgi:hypothetical protein